MTFKKWIKQFEGQDNVIGDLAEDIDRDGKFPETNNFEDIDFHLSFMGACNVAKKTFQQAWEQYKKRGYKQ